MATSQIPQHSVANASIVVRRALSRSTVGRGNRKKHKANKDSKDSHHKCQQTRRGCLSGAWSGQGTLIPRFLPRTGPTTGIPGCAPGPLPTCTTAPIGEPKTNAEIHKGKIKGLYVPVTNAGEGLNLLADTGATNTYISKFSYGRLQRKPFLQPATEKIMLAAG